MLFREMDRLPIVAPDIRIHLRQECTMRRTAILAATAVILAAVGALTWTQHQSWLARYYAGRLAKANESESPELVERLAHLGIAAVPHLLRLRRDDSPACRQAGLALLRIFETSNPEQRKRSRWR
jgi:hypothetical protein